MRKGFFFPEIDIQIIGHLFSNIPYGESLGNDILLP